MKQKITAIIALVTMLVSGCGKEALPDPINCNQPTKQEIALITPFIPTGFEIIRMRRVDTKPTFVFMSVKNSEKFHIDLLVFEINKSEVVKYYQMGSMFGEEISFGLNKENDYWVTNPFEKNQIICSVVFNLGETIWTDTFIKIFAIENGEFSEMDIDLNPWTVAIDMFEENDETLVRVLDARFEFFSDLCQTCTPARIFLYGMRENKLVNVTSENVDYVRSHIHNSMLQYRNQSGDNKDQHRIGYGLEAYLYAESGGFVDEYFEEVLDMLDPEAYEQENSAISAEARSLVTQAQKQNVPVAGLRGFAESDKNDIRWNKINWNIEELLR